MIVGLDLAGVEHRPTGMCILNNMIAQTFHLFNDEEIIDRIFLANPKIIAIDAPLSLPSDRKSLEDQRGSHLRESDRALLALGIKLFPLTLGPMRKLTARGIKLRETFEAQGFRVIEAYPGGAQDILGIPRKQQGLEKLRLGLEKLGIMGLSGCKSDHELDAATCAYVGKVFLEGNAVIYGDPKTGIVLPRKKE